MKPEFAANLESGKQKIGAPDQTPGAFGTTQPNMFLSSPRKTACSLACFFPVQILGRFLHWFPLTKSAEVYLRVKLLFQSRTAWAHSTPIRVNGIFKALLGLIDVDELIGGVVTHVGSVAREPENIKVILVVL
jgi:hypothetical protein